MFDINSIGFITLLLFLIAIVYFLIRNDEVPGLLAVFLFATGYNRYLTVVSGVTDWVSVRYAFNIFRMNDEKALLALNYFLLGTAVFGLSYMMFRSMQFSSETKDSQEIFSTFFQTQRTKILVLFGVFTLVNSLFSGMISGNIAFGNSYFYLFKMAIGGIIILAFVLFQVTNLNQSLISKIVFGGLIAYSISISYNPYLRFQFLSWLVAVVIMVFGAFDPIKKARFYVIGIIVAVLLFSLAGVARTKNIDRLSFEDKVKHAWERTKSAEDQNMLDGFMMVLDVYPEYLEFGYGMEHFEILLRPIPRKLWPDKPLGGYHNKLGLNANMSGTVGISQTIYGTFYGEGGVAGIIVFSILYAWLFARIMRYAESYNSKMRWLLKGITIASLIPILRGGDLPGIIAFIGMSYWPVFIYLLLYNRYLKSINQNYELAK
jgi:hypothetical protein